MPPPTQEGIHQDQELLGMSDRGHVGKAKSVLGREPLAWWVGKGVLQYLKLESDIWQILQEAVILRNLIPQE